MELRAITALYRFPRTTISGSSAFLRGAPPKVVWLRIGNAPTQAVVDLLGSREADVQSLARDADTALLVIELERDYP